MLLGAPVGDHEFKKEVIRKRVEKIRETTSHLPSASYRPLLQDFDAITREALNRILAVPVTDIQWAQAKQLAEPKSMNHIIGKTSRR